MLNEKNVLELVKEYGSAVHEGRSIEEIINDNDLPRLKNCKVQIGKVSDSIYSKKLVTSDGTPIRLMYRSNRISTHDQNRGIIPFKDQVLGINHNLMLNLVKDILGISQFEIPNLNPNSTVIASENLETIMFENVMRMFMAESSTPTSLYQFWKTAVEEDMTEFNCGGHKIITKDLTPNCKLPYLMDTPSTKEKIDKTVDPNFLIRTGIFTLEQYIQIRNSSSMAFGVVSQYLQNRGMILVDTKTEHGINLYGDIVSQDELYTMDSSRYWKIDDNGNLLLNNNGKPVSFSKEFGRGMIKEKNQQFTNKQVNEIATRYILGLQHLTKEEFKPDLSSRDERIINSTNKILDHLL